MQARILRAIVIAVLVSVVATGICRGGRAFATGAGWPFDVSAQELTGFGERYTSEDGSLATHRGIDLAAEAGVPVRAVLGGTVSFAGRVPAGEGATTIAVTVQTGDLRITLMPLSEASVRAGDAVAPGETLGVLAASGDRSHTATHLHVGVRRADLYIDPAPFLCPPVPASGHPAEAGVRDPAPSPAPAPAPATAPAPVARTASAGQPAPVTSAQAAATQQAGAGAATAVSGLQTAPDSLSSATRGLVGDGSGVVSSVPAGTGVESASGATDTRGGSGVGAGQVVPVELPAALTAAARALDLEPGRVSAALAVDRRPASVSSGSPVSRAAALGIASLVAAVALWPLWRTVPVPGIDVAPVQEDVAAAVSR